MKRGQVSIFIIISIVLLTVIVIAFFLSKTKLDFFSEKISPEITPIHNAMKTCIEQRTIDAVNLVGLQGGYVRVPDDALKTDFLVVAYGLQNGKNTLPSLKKIEDEISNYIEITVPFCIDEEEFSDFKIEIKEVKGKVNIQESVFVSVIAPLSIQKGEKTFSLENPYEITLPVQLKKMHQRAQEIIKKQMEEKNYILLSYLTENEFEITTIAANERQWIYAITDDSEINGVYSFAFAVDTQ